VAKVKYLGTVTNHNFIHKETNSRLNSGNSCYHAVQNLKSSYLLSENQAYARKTFFLFKMRLREEFGKILRIEMRTRILSTRPILYIKYIIYMARP
jgi:hypothetical protein